MELVERFADKVDWIMVAAWRGYGFKNQLETHENVICPYIMCEVEENGDPIFDKFVSDIGKPKVVLKIDGNKLKDILVLRSSPCRSTSFVADLVKRTILVKN